MGCGADHCLWLLLLQVVHVLIENEKVLTILQQRIKAMEYEKKIIFQQPVSAHGSPHRSRQICLMLMYATLVLIPHHQVKAAEPMVSEEEVREREAMRPPGWLGPAHSIGGMD